MNLPHAQTRGEGIDEAASGGKVGPGSRRIPLVRGAVRDVAGGRHQNRLDLSRVQIRFDGEHQCGNAGN